MLLEFGLSNFFSFREGARISFRLDGNCPDSISGGRPFATLLGIKGANGSGKTHILRGLSFLYRFCTRSFMDYEPNSLLAVDPFFHNENPIELFVDLLIGDKAYTYELKLTEKEVLSETIYRTISRKSKIFERVGTEITVCIAELDRLKTVKLRKNASIISTAHQYEFDELNDLYDQFNLLITNVYYQGLREEPVKMDTVSKFYNNNPYLLEFTNSFIKTCDIGISEVKIGVKELEGNKQEYYPFFIHSHSGINYPLTTTTESSGTKALFRDLLNYKLILDSGGLLLVDEIDNNLHPFILPKLVELFDDPVTNPKNAQLVFSTHNSEIIDLLGRHRVCCINKENNESYTYRLDELPGDILRNDRPISPIYNKGKIGGVPRI